MDPAEQLYAALQHSARRLRGLDEELGLSPARFSVLATLRFVGPQGISELARREGVAQPTMSQLVHAMEAADLLTRRPDPNDGRGCVVTLTKRGRALVRRARARKIAWIADALDGLSDDELRALQQAAASLDQRALDS